MLSNYLIIGAILFSLGAVGFMARRNMIVMFLSVEMMLQGVSLNLVAFGNAWENWHGQVFTVYLIAVAAAESGVALALFLVLYRRRQSLDVSVWQDLREAGQPAVVEVEKDRVETRTPEPWPKLPPAGVEPARTLAETKHG